VTHTVCTSAKRVLFDARPAENCLTGIGRYAGTLATLMKGVPGHFCWSLGRDLKWSPATPIEEELELPWLLEREEIDVFHSPLFPLPAVVPCRSVVTVHDAIPLVRPELSTPGFTRLFAERARDGALRADRVICPSEHAKKDVVATLRVPEEKVRVVAETPAPCFRVVDQPGPREHFLVVGSIEARKNPLVVLDAIARFPESERPKVVFVGPDAGIDLVAEAAQRGVERTVRRAGPVPDEELVLLYNRAVALIFPSLYEGFGLPVLEAFACGTPVIASSAASIPEVAGDAALSFDPQDPSALAEAMRSLGPEKAVELRTRGFARLERFSRERVSNQLAQLYSELDQ
jgi:glycosyltransferase involved in cell wall biosynthesis